MTHKVSSSRHKPVFETKGKEYIFDSCADHDHPYREDTGRPSRSYVLTSDGPRKLKSRCDLEIIPKREDRDTYIVKRTVYTQENKRISRLESAILGVAGIAGAGLFISGSRSDRGGTVRVMAGTALGAGAVHRYRQSRK